MKKVVVTGIGALTPLGNSFFDSWNAATKGLSGIAPIGKFDVSKIKWSVAGELKGFNPGQYLSSKEILRLDPFVQYAVAASLMAGKDAGLIKGAKVTPPPPSPPGQEMDIGEAQGKKRRGKTSYLPDFLISLLDSAAVIIGSSRGGITTIEKSLNRSNSSNLLRLSPYLMPSTSVNAAASYVSQKLGIKGHVLGISNACVSGANAIGEGYRLIKSGYAGVVLAGGAEAPVCRLCVKGYGATGALSKVGNSSASRPFDVKRDGFVLSEGACVLVLEEYEAAMKRGARIYGEIIGYGNASDAYHQTRSSSEGEARAIKAALKEAGIAIDDVDYINAHAASTPLGDRAEAEAIRLVFGKRAKEIPVSAVKSMTGHMLSASGAFESAITLMSIYEGVITPTINLKQKDHRCDLNCVTETNKAEIRAAVSNSFGFGGVNAVLAFKRVMA